ncbi:hypothetical protein ACS0TY_001432 [Phlomoides rotata]
MGAAAVALALVFVFIKLELGESAPQFPCFFIFGDSLVDNGNNNELNTTAKVNYLPYGIDFPEGPTGRFTNGRNIADILAQLLGFDTYIPPFATAQDDEIINGVNYASGSSGIRSETGERLGDRISMDRQLVNHNITISRIAQLLGNHTSAANHLNKCLYYFVVGSNDYINNYFQPDYYPSSSIYTPQTYAIALVQQYSQQLQTLYNSGARKIAVSGVGPLGCLPAVVGRGSSGSFTCVDTINDAVQLFNDELKLLVDRLNNNYTDAKFIYTSAMELNPIELVGPVIRILSTPCCQVSNTTGLCVSRKTSCLLRSLYFFYDNFHPTEVVNTIAAAASYIDVLSLIFSS